MARSKKDGRRGGNHRSKHHYAETGSSSGKKHGEVEFTRHSYRKFYKKKANRDIRRKSKEAGFKESDKHFQVENLTRLNLPTLLNDHVYADVTRAIEQSDNPDHLLKFLVDIVHKSNLLEDNTYIKGLVAVAKDSGSWIRSLETWNAETVDPGEQFSELTRHLFTLYDVPRFMDRAWLDDNPARQNWFKHIGAGKNIRTASDLPIALTKKMAHHFLTAPADYTIEAAVRWGQVHALGGNSRLAEALRKTYLVQMLKRYTPTHDSWIAEENKFWVNVIRFFISHPMLDLYHVPPIINYIRYLKFGDPQRNICPVQPNFTIKGRTPERLIDQMNASYREEEKDREEEEKGIQWKRSSIDQFYFTMDGIPWHIRELLSTVELETEASVMKHCVATYAYSCIKRYKAVWTMETVDYDPTVHKSGIKALTIAINLRSKHIIQVRGRYNRLPTDDEERIIQRWAKKENLTY